MALLDTFNTAVRLWLVDKSGLDPTVVIFADQNAPKPKSTFIRFKAKPSAANKGLIDESKWDKTTGDIIYMPVRIIDVTIDCFGEGAIDICLNLQNSLHLATVNKTFRASKIGIIDRGTMIDLTGLENGLFTERGNLVLQFEFQYPDITDQPGYYNRVLVDGCPGTDMEPVNLDISAP